jgi:hypothetical protein
VAAVASVVGGADMASVVVVEERKIDVEVCAETEVAGMAAEAAAAQSGLLEDKLTDQVVPGALLVQLGQTVCLAVEKTLVAVLEPEQGLIEEGLLATGEQLHFQRRTASHTV